MPQFHWGKNFSPIFNIYIQMCNNTNRLAKALCMRAKRAINAFNMRKGAEPIDRSKTEPGMPFAIVNGCM